MEEKHKKRSHDDEEHHGRDKHEEDTGEHESPLPEEDAAGEEDEPVIVPVEKSIGEGRDNLRQRESWFRRRSGGMRS
ncbi:MAG TPA: hypothetical protein VF735_04165 [Pyrinomonadaceae bacterium]|jgi:hypothetical protein